MRLSTPRIWALLLGDNARDSSHISIGRGCKSVIRLSPQLAKCDNATTPHRSVECPSSLAPSPEDRLLQVLAPWVLRVPISQPLTAAVFLQLPAGLHSCLASHTCARLTCCVVCRFRRCKDARFGGAYRRRHCRWQISSLFSCNSFSLQSDR
jgi:hypothetical protein